MIPDIAEGRYQYILHGAHRKGKRLCYLRRFQAFFAAHAVNALPGGGHQRDGLMYETGYFRQLGRIGRCFGHVAGHHPQMVQFLAGVQVLSQGGEALPRSNGIEPGGEVLDVGELVAAEPYADKCFLQDFFGAIGGGNEF